MNPTKVEAEYAEFNSRNAWPLVYQTLGRESQNSSYTFVEAKKPVNKPLNRYRDVNPYDHSRITLTRSENDYINANLVKMERANRTYILTQGPLAFTVDHFWLMVWEQNSRAILMLNKVVEKSEIKCHWYWPQGIGPEHRITLDEVDLTVEQISEEDNNYYSTRVFKLHDLETDDSRTVIQFHYMTWPDFGVPSSPNAFLEFLKKVRSSGALNPDSGPPIVHCSAGIGRSGTFCLVDSCLLLIETEGYDNVNIQEMLLELRTYRMGLIQTPDQLRFSYQAIIEGAKRLDPNYVPVEEEPVLDESIYAAVLLEQSEEAPPPPPPRGESLARPPARPLPAIPSSTSLGNLSFPPQASSSSVDEDVPPPLPPRMPSQGSSTQVSSTPTSSSDDDDDATATEPVNVASESGPSSTELRRRKQMELTERVIEIKRRARDAENWHALKRFKSEEKPQTEPRED